MVEESSPLLPPAEESIEAETDTALEPEPESGEPTPEPTSEPGFVCDCFYTFRSVCAGEPFFQEYGGKRYCVLHYPGEEKAGPFRLSVQRKLRNDDFNFAGVWFPNLMRPPENFVFRGDANFAGATFSAGVFFNSVTFAGNATFAMCKFVGSAFFTDVTFSKDAHFLESEFCDSANFGPCTFKGKADFSGSTFKAAADFLASEFIGPADFWSAKFTADASLFANFQEDACFDYVTFGGNAEFGGATFNRGLSFNRAVIKAYLTFSGHPRDRSVKDGTLIKARALGANPDLSLQYARIDKPERVSFHTLALRPHWFLNVDARKFDFVNVEWRGSLHEGIESLIAKGVPSPHRLLSDAYQHLAVNAEENDRYEEASGFRYWAMAARRREKWHGFDLWRRWLRWLSERWIRLSRHRVIKFLRRDRLHWFYWILSGYGERVLRAFVALVGIWLVFAWLYTYVGFLRWTPKTTTEFETATAIYDDVGEPLRLSRALTYSLGVMSLQRPEPRPATSVAQTLVAFETIMGPVQAALLALAIRRKFMR